MYNEALRGSSAGRSALRVIESSIPELQERRIERERLWSERIVGESTENSFFIF
jgi:hypothetical protein